MENLTPIEIAQNFGRLKDECFYHCQVEESFSMPDLKQSQNTEALLDGEC